MSAKASSHMSLKPQIALYIVPTDDQELKNITNHNIALMAAVSYNIFYMLSTFRINPRRYHHSVFCIVVIKAEVYSQHVFTTDVAGVCRLATIWYGTGNNSGGSVIIESFCFVPKLVAIIY